MGRARQMILQVTQIRHFVGHTRWDRGRYVIFPRTLLIPVRVNDMHLRGLQKW